MKFTALLKLFRLPNLPTAPGDALAGAAFVFCAACQSSSEYLSSLNDFSVMLAIIGSAFAALFFYMFGLADNDIVGVKEDIENNSPRPIPQGELTLFEAKLARAICLMLAVATGAVARLPWQWWLGGVGVFACVWFYNRFKGKCKTVGLLAMGLCRSMSLLAGALAIYGVLLRLGSTFPFPWEILFLMLGWTGYIAAVTYLAYDEHNAKTGLGLHYYLIGLIALAPIAGVIRFGAAFKLAPIAVCVYMFLRWIMVLSPLRYEHTPEQRRKAVGQTISALIFLQFGFALMPQRSVFYVPMLLCLLIAYFIKLSKARSISGS